MQSDSERPYLWPCRAFDCRVTQFPEVINRRVEAFPFRPNIQVLHVFRWRTGPWAAGAFDIRDVECSAGRDTLPAHTSVQASRLSRLPNRQVFALQVAIDVFIPLMQVNPVAHSIRPPLPGMNSAPVPCDFPQPGPDGRVHQVFKTEQTDSLFPTKQRVV